MGVSGKNVSGAMGIAQAAQAAATMLLLGWFLDNAGFRWTFVTGALCLTALYATYSVSRRASWSVLVQALFGLECVFCMAGGQMFVNAVAPAQITASAQSLIFIATYGIGQFLGTQLAGLVMERNRVDGKFQWPKIRSCPNSEHLLEGIRGIPHGPGPAPSDAAVHFVAMSLVIVAHREVVLLDCPILELDCIRNEPAFAPGIDLRLERLPKLENL